MFQFLEARIQRGDFEEMRRHRVDVLRVPAGYWNWVSYPKGQGPEAPQEVAGLKVAERLGRLSAIAPGEYRPYFDRIFEYANATGLQVFLELHGAPGTQNSEMHSGCITGRG